MRTSASSTASVSWGGDPPHRQRGVRFAHPFIGGPDPGRGKRVGIRFPSFAVGEFDSGRVSVWLLPLMGGPIGQ